MAQAAPYPKGDQGVPPLKSTEMTAKGSSCEGHLDDEGQRKKSSRFLTRLSHLFKKGRKDPSDLLEYYLNLAQKNGQNGTVHLKLAEIYQKMGEEEKAIAQFLQAAEIYDRKGYFPQAMAIYKQVLSINRHLIQANLKMGSIYRKMGLLADALAQYKLALNYYEKWGLKEKISGVRSEVAELEFLKNLQERKSLGPPQGQESPKAATAVLPPKTRGDNSRLEVSKLESSQGEKGAAFFDLGAELEAAEPVELKSAQDISVEKVFGFEEIFKELQETVVPSNVYPDFNFHLGVACREMGFNEAAIEQFQIALESGQKPIESAKCLSRCFREKGWFHEARKYYDKAMQMEGNVIKRPSGLTSQLVLINS